MSDKNDTLHMLAVVLGIVATVFIGLAVLIYYGYLTSAVVDGLTEADSIAYGTLALVGAIGAEFGAREL